MQPIAGAVGEEEGGGPAEQQGVSAAAGAPGLRGGLSQIQRLPQGWGDREISRS